MNRESAAMLTTTSVITGRMRWLAMSVNAWIGVARTNAQYSSVPNAGMVRGSTSRRLAAPCRSPANTMISISPSQKVGNE